MFRIVISTISLFVLANVSSGLIDIWLLYILDPFFPFNFSVSQKTTIISRLHCRSTRHTQNNICQEKSHRLSRFSLMRLMSSGLLNKIIATMKQSPNACEEGRKLAETSAALKLPDIWQKAKTKDLPHKKVSIVNAGSETFDFSLANQNSYFHDILVPQANELNPLLSQAISSIAAKKMTLDEIKRWLQKNVKNGTKTKVIAT